MEEKSKVIFGNPMPDKVYRKAVKSKKKYAKKFGNDAGADYPAIVKKNEYIGDMLGVHDIRVGETGENVGFDTEKGIIVGNIRMGFGHYRISICGTFHGLCTILDGLEFLPADDLHKGHWCAE